MAEPRAYYNEIDKYAAAWLRNLIAAGHIAPGDVDERDIRDVRPDELRSYTQCHFFAGIGVWSHGLRAAGWPDHRPVWTGSCPCQPFSAAGQGGGFDDERHLWPAFFHLIEECRPAAVFGEQVASKDGLAWLDLVQSDLEGALYAVGALDICAAGFGAPHIRQRLYWMADAPSFGGRAGLRDLRPSEHGITLAADRGAIYALADTSVSEAERQRQHGGEVLPVTKSEGSRLRGDAARGLADHDNDGLQGGAVETIFGEGWRQKGHALGRGGAPLAQCSGLGFANGAGSLARQQAAEANGYGRAALAASCGPTAGPVNGVWRDADWLLCRDGKWRPVRSGTFPLAHGAASRVGRLRAYGNAIVAAQAEEFIAAYLDTEHLRLTEGIFA